MSGLDGLRDDVDVVVRRAASRYAGLAAAAVVGSSVAIGAGGSADGAGASPTSDTVFQIGSITKTFTALLLAHTVLAGEVRLNTPVSELFPDVTWPDLAEEITLLHLATHTSGLPRLPAGMVGQLLRHPWQTDPDPYARYDDDAFRLALSDTHPRREPGRRIRYSNYGMAVLGAALERATGTSYGDLVRTRICEPLGMRDTTLELDDAQAARRAHGHNRRGKPVPDWNMPSMPGMGALYSTTADMARYVAAMLLPPVGRIGEAVAMTHEVRFGAGRPVAMCLAWHRSRLPRSRATMLWHDGGTGGFASFVGFVPEAGVGAVVLTNTAKPVNRVGVDLLKRLTTAATSAPA